MSYTAQPLPTKKFFYPTILSSVTTTTSVVNNDQSLTANQFVSLLYGDESIVEMFDIHVLIRLSRGSFAAT